MQFGVFYQLPCAPGQSVPQRYRETFEQIVYADQLGFNSAWLAEAHFDAGFSTMPAPLVVAAALSGRTERIRLGIGVSQLPLHNPVSVAEEAATVDIVTGGRLDFGIGRGTWNHNFDGFGIPWEERTTRLEEAVDILEQAWTDAPLTYHGRHYQFESVNVVPKPLQQPGPPLHIAANSPSTAEFAGRRGLHLLMAAPIHPWPDDFLTHLGLYRDSAAKRTAGNAQVSAVFFVFTAQNRVAVRRQMADSFARHPIGQRTTYETAEENMAIFGNPQECIDRIAEVRQRARLDSLICSFNPGGTVLHDHVKVAMQRFAEEVLPSVRDL
ncbi:MAG: LLM class flavin-dependent oxidoreductase [Desulfurellaceae bacterium]|nr:LLM class flavin-dependent oxidoreductase [Desulfurellaceae bacterium]